MWSENSQPGVVCFWLETFNVFKFPRTTHVQGSRLQQGDFDLEAVPWSMLVNKNLVVEEKIDGANAGISFEDSKLMLQSRGHYLRGGPREKHFSLFKQWAATHEEALFCLLGKKLVMYGEWMYAKHTCFYDALPHYFMEFDIMDKLTGRFMSTPKRRELISGAGLDNTIHSVLVLHSGLVDTFEHLTSFIGPSNFKTRNWPAVLDTQALLAGVSAEDAVLHTDMSDNMEGLYIKVEDGESVVDRHKFVRASFTNSILDQDEHWLDRPIVPNVLAQGALDKMFGA